MCTTLLRYITDGRDLVNSAAPLIYTGAEPPDPWWLASAILGQELSEDNGGNAPQPSLHSLCEHEIGMTDL